MVSARLVLLWTCLASAGCGNRFTSGSSGRVAGPPPPPPLPSEHASVGLVSVAGGAGRLRADWRRGSADVSALEFALFVSPDRDHVLLATPIPVDVEADHAIVGGLASGALLFVQLGVREHPLERFTASGPALTASTVQPLYVDPSAPPGSGDGLTPATATSDLVLVLLNAFVQGGGNVYVAGGDVPNAAFPLFTGVQLLGGFGPAFTLEERDPAVHTTRFLGVDTQTMFRVEAGAPGPAVLDGVELTGGLAVPSAVDVPQRACEVRGVVATGMSRGLKVRGLATGPVFDVLVSGCRLAGCGLEGMSVDAAANVVIERSTFDANGNEGADFNHLWAPDGEAVALTVRGSVFTRNGTEGLDVHLGAPAGGGTSGGRFAIDVSDCDFELNALDGARVDVDYETTPLWSARIVLAGSRSRANGEAGVHLDLDSTSTAFVYRLNSSANALDGFLLTSETATGMATLSCSALHGNLGHGARLALGNFGLCVANCVFAGNALGGIDSPVVRSSAHSCLFHLQPAPVNGVDLIACTTVDFASPAQFVRAPREYTTITNHSGATLTLSAPAATGIGFPFEIADDGMPRAVTSVAGTTIVVDRTIDAIRTPARGTFFDPGDTSTEDWRLAAGSLALGTGLAAIGAPLVDAGIFGAPYAGVPGSADALRVPLFRVADTTPHWTAALAPAGQIHVTFADGVPAPASVPGAVYGVSASGAVLGTLAFVENDTVVVAPPVGGWHAGDRIELHTGLASTAGHGLAHALVIPLRVQ